MQPEGSNRNFHLAAWLLSRIAFVAAHGVFLYWLNFLFDDPFHLGGNTLDARVISPASTCARVSGPNLIFDLALFAVWWGTHSILARKAVKQALGLWQNPVERPLYATVAWVAWLINVHFWRPIDDCTRWSTASTPIPLLMMSAVVMVLASLLIVGFLWSLPGHVFGTDTYRYKNGEFPRPQIIRRFPYSLVRHPAAAGFLWLYWALPSYDVNHLFIATLWTLFILIGTLLLEERALRSTDEFGREYLEYRRQVNAFYPNLNSLKSFLKRSPRP